MKSQEDVAKQPAKKPYASPRLVSYGAVRDLTAGGSAGEPEFGSSSKNKRS